MINVSTITNDIVEWLTADSNLAGFRITRGEFVNENPSLARNGWIGVYRRGVVYEPKNLGLAPNNYRGELEFDIVVQKVSMESGADAEDILEKAVKDVLDRVVQIPKTYIDHISNIIVEYTYLETDRKSMYFQGALLTFTAEVIFEVK